MRAQIFMLDLSLALTLLFLSISFFFFSLLDFQNDVNEFYSSRINVLRALVLSDKLLVSAKGASTRLGKSYVPYLLDLNLLFENEIFREIEKHFCVEIRGAFTYGECSGPIVLRRVAKTEKGLVRLDLYEKSPSLHH